MDESESNSRIPGQGINPGAGQAGQDPAAKLDAIVAEIAASDNSTPASRDASTEGQTGCAGQAEAKRTNISGTRRRSGRVRGRRDIADESGNGPGDGRGITGDSTN